jgi:hypothetical protein
MSDSKLRGVVHLIEETKTYGQKGFRKRLLVIEQDNGRFTNYIPVEFTQESCDRVDDLSLGDDVEISYRLSGRKWQRDSASEVKYFLSCEATNFRKMSGKSGESGDESISRSANDEFAEAAAEDDVPF